MNSLKGKTIAITRNEKDAAEFSALVSGEGGKIIALPTIEIVPGSSDAVKKFIDEIRLNKHEYCAFMSARAVEVLFGMAQRAEILESLKATELIAVGPKTRAKLEEFGAKVALVPEKFSSAGVVEMLSQKMPAGKKIIIPRSAASGDYAADALRSLGMAVTEVMLYGIRTCMPTKEWDRFARLLTSGQVDAVIFTSASTVSSFFQIFSSVHSGDGGLDHLLNSLTRVISIGPFTSDELRKRNVQYAEAREHTIMGTFELAKTMIR